MHNFSNKLDLTHSEIVTVLEDFKYGDKAKCYIPSLMTFLSNKEIIETKDRVSPSNVKNKKIDLLGIGKYTSCNYIELHVPKNLSDNESNRGSKGTQFTAIFVAGDINKCTIIGRYR